MALGVRAPKDGCRVSCHLNMALGKRIGQSEINHEEKSEAGKSEITVFGRAYHRYLLPR